MFLYTHALILAAGKSTRIASIAGNLPKPLLEIKGQPVIIHNIQLLKKFGIQNIWMNLHYQPEKIKDVLGDGRKWGVKITYVFEPEILGTSGALNSLRVKFQNAPFLVLYGDNFSDCDLSDVYQKHQMSKSIATVVVFDAMKSKNSGIAGGRIEVDSAGYIQRFIEGPSTDKSSSHLVNAGIYVLNPEIFNFIPSGFSDFGKDIFPALLKTQKIFSYCMKGYCLAVDTPEALMNTQKILAEGQL